MLVCSPRIYGKKVKPGKRSDWDRFDAASIRRPGTIDRNFRRESVVPNTALETEVARGVRK